VIDLIHFVEIIAGEYDHDAILHQRRGEIIHEVNSVTIYILEIANDEDDWLAFGKLDKKALHTIKITSQIINRLSKTFGFLLTGKQISLELRGNAGQ
jgi:hypothetical protein